MKYSIVYKVLNPNHISWCCPSRHTEVTYEPYKWTTPRVRGTHLFAYKSLSHLKAYHGVDCLTRSELLVYEARAVVMTDYENDFMICNFDGCPIKERDVKISCAMDPNEVGWFPKGTVACSRIKILECLSVHPKVEKYLAAL